MAGGPDVTPATHHPPLSSLENLLGNIQNLLKVAAESVRHEEKQWIREKGESTEQRNGEAKLKNVIKRHVVVETCMTKDYCRFLLFAQNIFSWNSKGRRRCGRD